MFNINIIRCKIIYIKIKIYEQKLSSEIFLLAKNHIEKKFFF